MKEQLIKALGLPDTATEDEIVQKVTALSQAAIVLQDEQERDKRIKNLMATANMIYAQAVETLGHHEHGEKLVAEREERERKLNESYAAKSQARAAARVQAPPAPAGKGK